MKRMSIVLVAAALAASAGVASAAPRTSEIHGVVPVQYYERQQERAAVLDDREARIDHRIQRGLNDGGITRREARQLYRHLAEYRHKSRVFRADGRLDRREFAELSGDLDRLAQWVRLERWDDQHRYR